MLDPMTLKNLRREAIAIDVRPMLAEVERGASAWAPLRLTPEPPGAAANSYEGTIASDRPRVEVIEIAGSSAGTQAPGFSKTLAVLSVFAEKCGEAIRAARLVRVVVGATIVDEPALTEPLKQCKRGFFALDGRDGIVLSTRDESVTIQQGEVWFKESDVDGCVKNDGRDPAIYCEFWV